MEHGQSIARRMGMTVNPDTFNPVIVDFYEQIGYLPDAILNYLLLLGWSLDDNAAISSIAVSVDGVLAGTANYGQSRPDVCAAFPGRAGCPNVGWTFLLDTSTLANGSHTLAIAAQAVGGQRSTIGSTFVVNN